MAIQTIRTCDKCGQVVPEKEQFWTVEIRYAGVDTYGMLVFKTAQWCRPCMVSAGIVGTKKEKEQIPPETKPPTFEDLIRDIVRDIVAEES